MKMTHEIDVLKGENADLRTILMEIDSFIQRAAQEGTAANGVELAVWRCVLEIGRTLFGKFLALVGTGDLGESVTLPDGRVCQRLDEVHVRRYVSIFGEFHLKRTAYGSREGQKIEFVPLDNRLQLPESAFSYLLQDWDQSLCVEEAFSQAGRTLQRMLGLKQSVDSLEHMNVQMAERVEDFREERQKPLPDEEGEVFVSSADGKGVVMRRGQQQEPAPAHRTKGKKASRKEMAIVGAVYSVDRYVRTAEEVVAALFADDRDQPKPARPKPCHKQTMASLAYTDVEGSHSGIEKTYTWILEELWRRNRDFVKEMVHLCDGQESLRHARMRHLPARNTTDILDLLHVTPRLWQAAHVFYAENSADAEEFVRARVLKVLQGKAELVVRGLREMGTKRKLSASKKATLTEICAFFEKNFDRMRYDEYLAKGYPIASGVIEGACRHLVKDRMERAGMHWTRRGAQAMLDVRSVHTNDDWQEYQQFRFNRETRRLYPWRELIEGAKYRLAA
jgi:hypothetical protein